VAVIWFLDAESGFQVADLIVEFDHDVDHGAGGGCERGGHRLRCGELLGAQDRLNLAGSFVDIAFAPPSFECRSDIFP